MVLFNSDSGIGVFINAAFSTTGSVFITLLLITFAILLLCLICRLSIEYSVIFVLPLHFAILSYYGQWMGVAGSFLIYAGLILAKNIL